MLALLRVVPIVCVCVLGMGCATLNLQKPTASVTAMSVQNVDAQGFTMNFDVNVSNPNSVALPLSAADYKLGVSGVDLLSGTATPDGSIPANGSRAIALPVVVPFTNLLAAEKSIRASDGNLPYDLSAGLKFDTGTPVLGQLRVPVTYSGTLPLRDVLKDPKALLGSDAAKKLAAMLIGRFFGH